MSRTVFLDRDGVINRNRDDYVKSWSEFEFLPGALDALRRLAERRFRVVVVTNQGVINRGIISREVAEDINQRMAREVAANGGRIEATFYCPHRPDENCRCRKPKPGLLYRARDELDIDLSETFFVGDHISDVEAARAAACRTSILVLSGRHRSGLDLDVVLGKDTDDLYLARDLSEAVALIDAISQYCHDRHPWASNRAGCREYKYGAGHRDIHLGLFEQAGKRRARPA